MQLALPAIAAVFPLWFKEDHSTTDCSYKSSMAFLLCMEALTNTNNYIFLLLKVETATVVFMPGVTVNKSFMVSNGNMSVWPVKDKTFRRSSFLPLTFSHKLFPQYMFGLSFRERRGRSQSRVAGPPHQEEPVQVVCADGQDACWTPSRGEVFWACPTGRRPWDRPRTRWRGYISWLVWEHLPED